jgi:cell filamentation protein
MTESTDPYLYPGTDVLKNLRDIRDPDILARFEAEATSRRLVQLINSPVPGRFDTAQLKAIHKHIFQDIYAWAGQFRTVNISKGGHPFGTAAFVEPALNDLLQKLSAENSPSGSESQTVRQPGRILLRRNQCRAPFPRR